MKTSNFAARHYSDNQSDIDKMMQDSNVKETNDLIKKVIPKNILQKKELNLPNPFSEYESLNHLKELAEKNKTFKTYIGYGYNPTILPAVIQRNILENPSWYTAYTPYQAEIAQGRLEALFNFQTVVSDLTALPIANASLLDESTACAEAMNMLYSARSRDQKKNEVNQFFVSNEVLPQSISVIKTKAEKLGIELIFGDITEIELTDKCFGILLQYPGKSGRIIDYSGIVAYANDKNIKTVVAADILSLSILKPPGEFGADIVVGTTQRFGIPMGYGGPHAGFIACKEDYKRQIPGRIIGLTKDKYGNDALRMALQTREQHIKRERATSNICTAQVLLAVMASMYAVYHGKEGITSIAKEIHKKAIKLSVALKELGYDLANEIFFDTIQIKTKKSLKVEIQKRFEKKNINLNYFEDGFVSISLNETTSDNDLKILIKQFAKVKDKSSPNTLAEKVEVIPESLQRTSDFLSNPIFNSYRTETELMRYIKRLERKDLALNHSMIPLGSCTMKLNAASELLPLSWPGFANVHPFVPTEQAKGYQELITSLEKYLSEITGFHSTTIQPNSGAQGEYAGLMTIRKYQESIGEGHRNVVFIPASAHGTNPASAVLAGCKVVVIKNKENGETDLEDLQAKAKQYENELSALMITYPSTYGVFDANIIEVTQIVHQFGGQIYMDGANMNAQIGYTSPAKIGADVCHLNLHKTFAIPHGGGGPGVGPICVAEHLTPFLPSHPLLENPNEKSLGTISAAPYGSAFILTISYAYIRMLGADGLKNSTLMAILNANYLKSRLEKDFSILYQNENGVVAHEFILDCRPFKKVGIEVTDIAKRLMDYGFHAPTVSFPVAGTLMIEPTESESKDELDRFADALLEIKKEIDEIANGDYPTDNNVLKNAPHTETVLTSDDWEYPYSRTKAAYPLEWIRERKFFASVSRIDDAYGDRNLICTCPDIESYTKEVVEKV